MIAGFSKVLKLWIIPFWSVFTTLILLPKRKPWVYNFNAIAYKSVQPFLPPTILQERRAKRAAESDGDDDTDYDDDTEFSPSSGLSRSKSINRQRLVAHSTALESIQAESEPIDAEDDVPWVIFHVVMRWHDHWKLWSEFNYLFKAWRNPSEKLERRKVTIVHRHNWYPSKLPTQKEAWAHL